MTLFPGPASPPALSHPAATRRALHAIAVFEGIKGVAALAAVLGVLDLVHHDVRHLALELIGHFHLNPEARYSSVLMHYAELLPGIELRSLIALASGYIALRWLESYGLWNDYAWGEWVGAVSGGLYVPFELIHLIHRHSLVTDFVLASNVVLVVFLSFQLWRRHRAAQRRLP